MSEPKWTPGPWRVVPNPQRTDGVFVCTMGEPAYEGAVPPGVVPVQLPHADAHLIAAAPDLYRHLRHCMWWLDEICEIPWERMPEELKRQWQELLNHYDACQEALAKARGES